MQTGSKWYVRDVLNVRDVQDVRDVWDIWDVRDVDGMQIGCKGCMGCTRCKGYMVCKNFDPKYFAIESLEFSHSYASLQV